MRFRSQHHHRIRIHTKQLTFVAWRMASLCIESNGQHPTLLNTFTTAATHNRYYRCCFLWKLNKRLLVYWAIRSLKWIESVEIVRSNELSQWKWFTQMNKGNCWINFGNVALINQGEFKYNVFNHRICREFVRKCWDFWHSLGIFWGLEIFWDFFLNIVRIFSCDFQSSLENLKNS